MAEETRSFRWKRAKGALIGVMFGCSFPVIATAIDLAHHSLAPTLHNIARLQGSEPLHWIIDTAPLFLGLAGLLIGRHMDLLELSYRKFHVDATRQSEVLAQVNAELEEMIGQRQLVEADLRHHVETEKLITGISTRLFNLAPGEMDDALNDVVERLGWFHDVDRSYIVQYSDDGTMMDVTHAWFAPGIDKSPLESYRIAVDRFAWWSSQLRSASAIRIPRVADLPPEATAERAALEDRDVVSLICVPIVHGGRPVGFLGFDSVRRERAWDEDTAALLKVVGELVHGAMDRQRAERQLRLHSTALEQAGNGILITDLDGTIRWVNPGFTRLTGYEAEEILGRNPRILKSGEQDETMYDELWETILEGEVWQGELWNRRKDGSVYREEMTIAPVRDDHGKVSNFISIKQDITVRKRAEEALEHAKASAEEASRLKSEFLANMSHEIRTPLNGVVGMTDLALDTELTEEQRDYLHTCKLSAEALMDIINDILDFSKIEAGRLDLETIPFSLPDCVDQALRPFSLRANQQGVELAYHVRPEIPDQLLGDPGRLRQILVNLVGNAIKFTEEGEIVVRVALQSRQDDRVRIHVAVADTGIGIAEDKQQLIFDAFSQEDGSTTRRFGGTGLGLAISRQLVEMMGGRIWVESEAGRGSTFQFTVEFATREDPRDRVVPVHLSALAGRPALVVDDNEANRRILEEMLRNWKVEPVTVRDGHSALKELGRAKEAGRPFAFAILDGQMPSMDGFALAERIRRDPGLEDLRLLMLTSAGRRGDGARCRELGVDAYLTKPIGSSDLLEAIRSLLAPGREAKPGALVTRHSLRESRRRLRILLAEDNLVNRRVAARMLEKRGHTVVGVENGLEALDRIRQEEFDVILMDVQMPEMDGFEATAAIRSLEQRIGGRIPIVALTAHALKGDEERCLASGMDAYVAKPIDRTELLATVERITRDSSYPTELDPGSRAAW